MLSGKIQVLKSLALSQLTNMLTPLAINRFISEKNDIFYSFLWNNKGDKILINNHDHGRLKMVDLAFFNKSLKTSWLCKYLDTPNHGKWKELVELDLDKHGGNQASNNFLSNLYGASR